MNIYRLNYAGFFSIIVLIELHRISHAESFETCDSSYNISTGVAFLKSPFYPNNYTAGSSCRYTFDASSNAKIEISCTISLAKNPQSCSTEKFYLALDGDFLLRNSEIFCGKRQFTRTSVSNKVVLAYTSEGSVGWFKCKLFSK